jgi:NADH dehydrogenase
MGEAAGPVLVAGGTGFIGRAVVRRLVDAGIPVRVMTAHPERTSGRIRRMGAEPVLGDVMNPGSLTSPVSGSRALIQALTFPTFPVEKKSRGFTFEEFDHRGTARLVAAAKAAGVSRYVFCSGSGAAPDARKTWFRAKWAGEEAVRSSGVPFAVVRPSWVYGPEDRALNRFVRFARLLPFVPVVGEGRQRLQPVFVDDVAEILVRAARTEAPTATFELGGPQVMSMDDVLRTMLDVLGKRRRLVHVPAILPKAAGFFLQVLPNPPLSPGAVDFLTGDAVADVGPLLDAFDVRLTPLREGLATYL